MTSLLAVESLCAGCGAGLLLCGLACCCVPRCFRLGVILMCLGDVFFVLAVAYPRRLTAYLEEHGLARETLGQDYRWCGALAAVALSAAAFALYRRAGLPRASGPRTEKRSGGGAAP